MFKELDLGGIFVAPIFGCLLIAGAIFVPLSWYFDRCELHNHVANRPIFDVSVFVILLGVIIAIFQFL
jgi:acyl-CoA synthetase (AMP-forming)/AMP-acid ligase II